MRDDARNPLLGPLELRIMRLLWETGERATVRQVLGGLNAADGPALAYTTVMTVLGRLHDKGAVSRDRCGRGFAYRAEVPDQAALAVRGVLRDYGDTAVARFVDQVNEDPRLRARLEALLAENPASGARADGADATRG